MLANLQELVSVNATSTINGNVVSYMTANISQENGMNVNNSIQDTKVYLENQAEVEKDFDEFRAKVAEISNTYIAKGVE